MLDDEDPDGAARREAAWRSGGAQDLARELVLAARLEEASLCLQAEIASVVLATEGPPAEADIAHALRA